MEVNEAVGRNLKDIRKKSGLSIGALSTRTGLSKAVISQIEQGNANPTINTIFKLAEALNVPYTDLLNVPESGINARILDDVQTELSEDGLLTSRIYYPKTAGRSFDIKTLTLAPGCEYSSGGSVRYIIVKKGELTVAAGEFSYWLMEGDTVSLGVFDECTMRNESEADVELFCVTKPE